MFDLLYNYFNTLFYDTNGITYELNFDIGGFTVGFNDWLCYTCALISLIFILVLCCLFIYRLIRLVGRLFSGGAL